MGIPSCKKAIAAGAAGVKAKIESVKGQSAMAWFLQILVAAQFLMILYVNYTKAYGLFDYDSAPALFGEETVTLEQVAVPEGEQIEFRIRKSRDAIITVKQFTFERVR